MNSTYSSGHIEILLTTLLDSLIKLPLANQYSLPMSNTSLYSSLKSLSFVFRIIKKPISLEVNLLKENSYMGLVLLLLDDWQIYSSKCLTCENPRLWWKFHILLFFFVITSFLFLTFISNVFIIFFTLSKSYRFSLPHYLLNFIFFSFPPSLSLIRKKDKKIEIKSHKKTMKNRMHKMKNTPPIKTTVPK